MCKYSAVMVAVGTSTGVLTIFSTNCISNSVILRDGHDLDLQDQIVISSDRDLILIFKIMMLW